MKKIVSLFLLCACCFSLFSCSLLIEDEKTEWQTSFVLGAIDANGNSVSSKSSLRTSEAIPCDGITLVPDLWFSMEYRFFFYDENGVFVGYTPAMSGTSDAKIPSGAVYAHIVMTPFDENGRPFYSIDPLYVVDYAEKVTVKIDRKQRYNPNLCEIAKLNKYTGRVSVGSLAPQEIVKYSYYQNANITSKTEKLKLSSHSKKNVFVLDISNVKILLISSEEKDDNLVGFSAMVDSSYCYLTVGDGVYNNTPLEIVEGTQYFIIETPQNISINIYEYR